MKLLVLGMGLAIFAAVACAVNVHFVSAGARGRFTLLSALSAGNIFVFGRELWLRQKNETLLLAALCLFVVSAVLFGWAVHASRSARLKLIFAPDNPQFILQSGPYRFIRHPFYACYILFWLGCALATLHPINVAYLVLIIPLLVIAARHEEAGFGQTPQASAYAEYRRRAGMFWPKLG
ncbi:MAG: methyltransferase family protein [Hyphomicrobiaceae bacterium]